MSKWLETPIEKLQLELNMPERTGYYDPEGKNDLPEDDRSYDYQTKIVTSGAGLFVTIFRDGVAYSSIPCDSIQEAEWFQERNRGRRPRS